MTSTQSDPLNISIDLSFRQRYEAYDSIYTIYSTGDRKVGFEACGGRKVSEIVGETAAFQVGHEG